MPHKNHYLYFIFEEVMQRTTPAGLPLYLWYKAKSFQQRIRLNDTTVYEQLAFTLENLDYALFLFLITSLISIIAFVGELVVLRLRSNWVSKEKTLEGMINSLACVDNEGDSPQVKANDDNMSITSEDINDYCIEIAEVHHSDEQRMNESESAADDGNYFEEIEAQAQVEEPENSRDSIDDMITEFELNHSSSYQQNMPQFHSGFARTGLFSLHNEEGFENDTGMIANTLKYLDTCENPSPK
jgi:hypothetical protein